MVAPPGPATIRLPLTEPTLATPRSDSARAGPASDTGAAGGREVDAATVAGEGGSGGPRGGGTGAGLDPGTPQVLDIRLVDELPVSITAPAGEVEEAGEPAVVGTQGCG